MREQAIRDPKKLFFFFSETVHKRRKMAKVAKDGQSMFVRNFRTHVLSYEASQMANKGYPRVRKDRKAVKGMWSCEPNATA